VDPLEWVRRAQTDPVRRAREAQDALDRFQESRPCAWLGCTYDAVPQDAPYIMGYDQNGVAVWFRRWLCSIGHHYDLETSPPEESREREG
jgi:hypothetical protein